MSNRSEKGLLICFKDGNTIEFDFDELSEEEVERLDPVMEALYFILYNSEASV